MYCFQSFFNLFCMSVLLTLPVYVHLLQQHLKVLTRDKLPDCEHTYTVAISMAAFHLLWKCLHSVTSQESSWKNRTGYYHFITDSG